MLTEKEIKNEFRTEEEYLLEASPAIQSEDFQSVKNIKEEKSRKLFKSIVDPAEGLIVNDQITIEDWNLDNNNTDRTISLSDNMKAAVNDIVKNVIETNNEETPIPMLEDKS